MSKAVTEALQDLFCLGSKSFFSLAFKREPCKIADKLNCRFCNLPIFLTFIGEDECGL